MELFETMHNKGHEQVVFFNHDGTGLKAIVAIHDTTLGPALGGLRMWPYQNEEEALRDVLRLSRGMTYKAAVAGLNLGGGKAVVIGDRRQFLTALLVPDYENLGEWARACLQAAPRPQHSAIVESRPQSSGPPRFATPGCRRNRGRSCPTTVAGRRARQRGAGAP